MVYLSSKKTQSQIACAVSLESPLLDLKDKKSKFCTVLAQRDHQTASYLAYPQVCKQLIFTILQAKHEQSWHQLSLITDPH